MLEIYAVVPTRSGDARCQIGHIIKVGPQDDVWTASDPHAMVTLLSCFLWSVN